MTARLHLDTHLVVWLYAGEHDRIPPSLRDRLNSASLRFSPMVRLELTYLQEIGRLTEPPERIVGELASAMGLTEDDCPFATVIDVARRMTFTRDPFDRIITAQAAANGDALASKDDRILAAYPDLAVWN